AYLLWPTWEAASANGPGRLPVSVGGTLFNVPTAAIRRKIQRHSGPQERVDLSFVFPSLEPPERQKPVSADSVDEQPQPIDRIFDGQADGADVRPQGIAIAVRVRASLGPDDGEGLVHQVLFQDRHLELERAIVILVIDEQHADEFLADIDLGRVVLFRPRHDA